jgi:hypothetical protein
LLETKKKKFLVRESEAALLEYQGVLEALTLRDYQGFVEGAKKLALKYAHKDFGPVLLYQAWGVARYDLKDLGRAEEILSKLKKEYSVSDWAYPEKIPKSLTAAHAEKDKKSWGSGWGKFLLPLNFFRGFFKKTTEKVFGKIEAMAEKLREGQTSELILDEKSAEDYFEPLLPAFAQESLRGYQINLTDEGVDVFVGVRSGIFDIVFSGRVALVAEEKEGVRTMRLRLREIRVQGVPVPRAFLRQIEKDFDETVKNEPLSTELTEAKYWTGGAKIIFKRKNRPVLSEENTGSVSQDIFREKKKDE